MTRLFNKVIRANLANEGIFDFFRGQDDHYDNLHNERMQVLKEMHDLGELKDHEPFHFGPAVGHYTLNGVVFPDARLAAGALDELGRFAEAWVHEFPRAVAQLAQHAEREIFRPALAGKELDTLSEHFNAGKSFYPAGLKRFLSTQRLSRFTAKEERKVPASENFAGDWFVVNLNEGGWQRLAMGFDWQKDFNIDSPKSAELAPYRASDVRMVMAAVEKIMDAVDRFESAEHQIEQSLHWLQQQQGQHETNDELNSLLETLIFSAQGFGEREGMYRFILRPAEVAIKLCHLSIKRMGK